jgi:hypothetical protein
LLGTYALYLLVVLVLELGHRLGPGVEEAMVAPRLRVGVAVLVSLSVVAGLEATARLAVVDDHDVAWYLVARRNGGEGGRDRVVRRESAREREREW